MHDKDAIQCVYCGETLNPGTGILSALKYPRIRMLAVIAVLVVLACFVMLAIW